MRENSTKKRRLSIKLTQEDWDAIHRKAELSNKNLTDYVTTCCLGKEIVWQVLESAKCCTRDGAHFQSRCRR